MKKEKSEDCRLVHIGVTLPLGLKVSKMLKMIKKCRSCFNVQQQQSQLSKSRISNVHNHLRFHLMLNFMASSPNFLLLFIILLLSCCFAATQSLDPLLQNDASTELDGKDFQRVEISVYYEALCPYCGNFILNQLVKLFKTDIVQIANLRLIPWGNASFKAKNAISCQHGPDECRLNTIEACAIHTWPDFKRHYGLVHCIERLVFTRKENQLKSCFKNTNEWHTLQNCYKSGLGTQLDMKYGDETTHLNPPLQFVPWVVVDGHALMDDYGNFLAYICRAYSGPKPKGCGSVQHKINSFDNVEAKP